MRAKTLADIPPEDVEPLDTVKARLFAGMRDLTARKGDTMLPAREIEKSISAKMNGEKLPAFTMILIKHLEKTDYLYSEEVVVFLSMLIDRAGISVMWAYTLFEMARRTGEPITFDQLVFMFPNGFPTNEACRAIWEHQKGYDGAPSNWLDTEAAWKV